MKSNHNPTAPGSLCLPVAAMLCMAVSALQAQDYSSFFSGNGSFEFGSSAPPLVFPNNNSSVNTITGWRFTAAGQYPKWLEDGNSQDGNRYIELTSNGGAGAGSSGASIDGSLISHTPFTIGELYELSFWAAGGAAPDNFVRVNLDFGYPNAGVLQGISIPTYTQGEFDALSGLEWNRYVIPFTATNNSMSFSIGSPSSTTGGYLSVVYLDNFSISQVPEPSSALLAGVGGLVLLVGGRRRAGSSVVVAADGMKK